MEQSGLSLTPPPPLYIREQSMGNIKAHSLCQKHNQGRVLDPSLTLEREVWEASRHSEPHLSKASPGERFRPQPCIGERSMGNIKAHALSLILSKASPGERFRPRPYIGERSMGSIKAHALSLTLSKASPGESSRPVPSSRKSETPRATASRQ